MGCRVPLRGRINESIMTGLRVVDTILPIGRGQRQLIIGDRFTAIIIAFNEPATSVAHGFILLQLYNFLILIYQFL